MSNIGLSPATQIPSPVTPPVTQPSVVHQPSPLPGPAPSLAGYRQSAQSAIEGIRNLPAQFAAQPGLPRPSGLLPGLAIPGIRQAPMDPLNLATLGAQTQAALADVQGFNQERRVAQLVQLAQGGDAQALLVLAHLAGSRDLTRHLDYGTIQRVREAAIDGLRANMGALGEQHLRGLIQALENDSSPGRMASQLLGDLAGIPDPLGARVAELLRQKIGEVGVVPDEELTGGAPTSGRAADALAHAVGMPHGQAGDLGLLLGHANLGGEDGVFARQVLQSLMEGASPEALAAVRQALAGGTPQAAHVAARLFGDVPERANAADAALLRTAALGGNANAARTLGRLATRIPPVPGAIEGLVAAMAQEGPAQTSARIAFSEAYSSLSPEQRRQHAHLLTPLDYATPEARREAVTCLGDRARTGDVQAVQALTQAFSSQQTATELRSHVAGALRDAAAGGGTAAADALRTLAQGSNIAHVRLALDALKQAAARGNAHSAQNLAALLPTATGEARTLLIAGLGQVAATAPASTAAVSTSLGALRTAVADTTRDADAQGGARQAILELGRVATAGRVGAPERAALLDAVVATRPGVASEALAVLAQIVRQMPAGAEKNQLLQQLRDKITAVAPALGVGDTAALQSILVADLSNPDARRALLQLVRTNADGPTNLMAARALATAGVFETLDGPGQAMVARAIGNGRDPALSTALLGRHPEWTRSPITDQMLTGITTDYSTAVVAAVRAATPNSVLGRYGRLMAARQMAHDLNNPTQANRNLAWRIDLARVDCELQALMASPAFIQQMDQIRQGVVTDFKARNPNLVRDTEAHLSSPGFQNALALMPEHERRWVLQQELGKLAALDKPAAERSAAALMEHQARQDVSGLAQQIHAMPGGEEAHASAFEHLADTLITDGKIGSKAAKNIVKALAEIEKGLVNDAQLAARLAARLSARLQAAERGVTLGTPGAAAEVAGLRGALGWVARADARGVLSTVATGASLLCLANDIRVNGWPTTATGWSRAATTLVSTIGASHNLSKLFVRGGVSNTHLIGKLVHGARWLGPAADAAGAVLDTVAAVGAYRNGDMGRTAGYGMQAAGGVASAAAGVAILAGCTGPAAPIVLIGGTVLILGGMAVNYFCGDSEEEQFLKALGRDLHGNNDYFLPARRPDSSMRRGTVGNPGPIGYLN